MYEEWKNIENTGYQVSNFGRFRKWQKKNYRYLKPFNHQGVYVIKINGKPKSCARLVANYHIRPVKENEVVYHKNKLEFDNFVRNLKIISREELGKKTGHISNCRRVVEIKNNEIIREWRSARRAAKELYVSYQTVSDYCNNKVTKPIYNLMWEDDYFRIIGF